MSHLPRQLIAFQKKYNFTFLRTCTIKLCCKGTHILCIISHFFEIPLKLTFAKPK